MTTEKLTRYDSADYLTDETRVEAYLEAAMEDDDPSVIAHALGVVARARNMSQLARDTGISREGLNKALSGQGNPTLETIMKVSKALGLRMAFHSVKASTLEGERDLSAT
ncbi:addiction module antidote protein [uncultured Roseibium sp.]|uniref:addiction module antidote protein n=1 Tax=uncultured Roseibium sp. TaxID=1936171 RepID=UPI003216E041